MDEEFNYEEARKFLLTKEKQKKEQREVERIEIFNKTVSILKNEFKDSSVEVYLTGSILQPFEFYSDFDDIDIVLINYHNGQFDLWSKLENEIGRTIKVFIFEHCYFEFQKSILKYGLKIF